MKGKFNKLSPNRHTANEERLYTLAIDIDTDTAMQLSSYFFNEIKVEDIEFSVKASPGVKSFIGEFDRLNTPYIRLGGYTSKKYCCGSRKRESDMQVIFNKPATILYKDGKKYVSKCDKEDTFSEELGLALCLLKSFGVSYSDFEKLLKGAKRQGVNNGK